MSASTWTRAPGIGLSVIRALAETVTIEPGPDGRHAAVEMDVRRPSATATRCFECPSPRSADHGWPASAADEVALSVSPVTLLPSVLGRMARTLAATAHFSLDRFSDVYLVTDALAAHAAPQRHWTVASTRAWRRRAPARTGGRPASARAE